MKPKLLLFLAAFATSATQAATLTASDGATSDRFGSSVSPSGSNGLVGAYRDDDKGSDSGSAYVFRSLNTATGIVTESAKLIASDGAASDGFGYSVSLSGSIGLVGAISADFRGAAYVFRNLNTATGTVTENAKLTAPDEGQFVESFGCSVSLSGSIGLVGASLRHLNGAAYIFRNLDTTTGTVTQNAELIASDGAKHDGFGDSVSLSGSIGLVGAQYGDDKGSDSGSAYVFRNLNTATGSVTEDVKLIASDGAANDQFGNSVSLDGDNFLIGAYGKNNYMGKAYSGSISSVTTLDEGNASRTISGISFVSQDDWIIGQSADNNTVTLSAGDTADVTASGKAVYIGKNAGSDNNTLVIDGTLIANEVHVGGVGNTDNTLLADGTITAGSILVAADSAIGGGGVINGDLTLEIEANFIFDLTTPLTVTGSVTLDSSFGIANLIGFDESVDFGSYTLIANDSDFSHIQNWGAANAYDLGEGKYAYFRQGSLIVEVILEPTTGVLVVLAASTLLCARRRRRED